MKIAIFPNFEKEGTADILERVVNVLSGIGVECYSDINTSLGLIVVEREEIFDLCDIVITIGGDGTLIKYAKYASRYGKPCLGINTGRLGFLTNLEKNQLNLLEQLVLGNYDVEDRMMLSVKATSGNNVIYEGFSLNDVVVSSGSVAKITDISLNVSGDEIGYLADGVILSTPTGSTAYSMSAGGPIIDPKVRCITVTPICSHSLTARPILAHESAEMTLSLRDTSRTSAFLTVDGDRCCEVDFNTKIKVTKAPFDAKLINISSTTIYKTVSKKF